MTMSIEPEINAAVRQRISPKQIAKRLRAKGNFAIKKFALSVAIVSTSCIVGLGVFGVNPASAATCDLTSCTYNPATDGLPGTSATAGFIDSWFVPSKVPGVGPPPLSNPDAPPNQNPATIDTFVEGLTGLNATLVTGGAANCGQPGFSCTGNVGASDLLASLFAVHLGGGELVFLYPNAINNFSVTVGANGDIQGGLGLSNIRAYNTTAVPIPPALLMFLSGLVMVAWVARKGRTA
jgi:hypothetical protein